MIQYIHIDTCNCNVVISTHILYVACECVCLEPNIVVNYNIDETFYIKAVIVKNVNCFRNQIFSSFALHCNVF